MALVAQGIPVVVGKIHTSMLATPQKQEGSGRIKGCRFPNARVQQSKLNRWRDKDGLISELICIQRSSAHAGRAVF